MKTKLAALIVPGDVIVRNNVGCEVHSIRWFRTHMRITFKMPKGIEIDYICARKRVEFQ